jgi:hypothetical protein
VVRLGVPPQKTAEVRLKWLCPARPIAQDWFRAGISPGDLPIERPTQLELVVNLKTAKSMGLTIPEPFLLLADEVIE